MSKDTLISCLDFFAGLFAGIALACGGLCFFIFSDFGLVVSIFLSLFVFALFSFFALISKSISAMLKENSKERL
ncbi:hypothetical protein [Helicobacter suis]|uniref:hypothetical protein n=1 Tax=Helicobacter suis TaxID=104628 RepID=UPI0013D620B2|nr:hypothetical protein [Helicobacter suis]